MTTAWLRTALPALALLGAAIAQPALANCDWYVKTSLEQQQRNLKLKCAHASWCASVGPDTSKASAQKREAQLSKCAAK